MLARPQARRPRRGAEIARLPSHLPPVAQKRVRQHAGHHRLADRNGADPNARVVAAFGDDLRILEVAGDRAAGREDRGCRLDSETGDDRLPGRDAAENAARVVGEKSRPPVFAPAHLVRVPFAGEFCRSEAVADLDPLDGVDPHQRSGKFRIELAVDRRAPACRDALSDNLNDRADRGARLADIVEIVRKSRGGGGVRTEERVPADLVPIPARPVDPQFSDLHQRPANTYGGRHFTCDRAGGDSRGRLTRRGPAAAAIIADPVLRLIGVIGVTGTVLVLDFAVVLRPLIDVLYEHADRRSGRHLAAAAVIDHHAGKDARLIRLAALGGESRRAWPPPVEFGLDVGHRQWNPRRAPVDDAPYSRAMTFAEGGDAKKMPETVVGHGGPDARYIRTAVRAVKPPGPRRAGSPRPAYNVHFQFIFSGACHARVKC